MPILTRHQIHERIMQGGLKFVPMIDQYQDQPHAVDLRLGETFYIPKIWRLTDAGREIVTVDTMQSPGDNFEQVTLKSGQFFDLAPGEAIIGSTLERIELNAPDLMAVLYPRSSINRRGLSVDLTGIVDVGYQGHLMIPIRNRTTSQVIRIYPGERLCQIVFQELGAPLSPAEAARHGGQQAKYMDASAAELANKQDAAEEIELLKQGQLEELKLRYRLNNLEGNNV